MQTLALVGLVLIVVGVSFVGTFAAARVRRRWLALSASLLVVGYGLILMTRPAPVVVGGIVGALAAVAAGVLFGRVGVPNLPGLTAFLVTASVLDVLSVRGGPTSRLFEAASNGDGLVYYLVILLPWEDGFLPVVGVSDVFGLSVIFASLLAMGAPRWLTFACGLSGMAFALAAGLFLGGVPAYPLLAAFALPVGVWSHRRAAQIRRP